MTEKPCRPPRSAVDSDLHRCDRCAPRDSNDRVAASAFRDFRRRRLEPGVAHRRERPQRLAVALLLSNLDVVTRHEASREAMVGHLDARQPLDVGDSVPPGGNQPYRETMIGRQRLAVHLVAEQVVAAERVAKRHAAGELLGDRQVQSAVGIGLDRAGQAATDDSRRCRGWSPCRDRPHRRSLHSPRPGGPTPPAAAPVARRPSGQCQCRRRKSPMMCRRCPSIPM